jgi:hypothetical protein
MARDGAFQHRQLIFRRSESEIQKAVKMLERKGWKRIMEPKMDVDWEGHVRWVCVLENTDPRRKGKKHPFMQHWGPGEF